MTRTSSIARGQELMVGKRSNGPSREIFMRKVRYMVQSPDCSSSVDRTVYEDDADGVAAASAPACDAISPSAAASAFSTRTPLALGSVAGAVVVGVALPEVEEGVAAAGAADDELLSCHAGNPGGLIANGRFGDETLVERPPPEVGAA